MMKPRILKRTSWPSAQDCRVTGFAADAEGSADQDRDEQDLENFTFGEGIDKRVRNDAEEEASGGETARRIRNFRNIVIQHEVCRVQADPWLEHVDGDKAKAHRDGRQHLEINKGLQRQAAELAHVRNMRQAENDGTENDWSQHHAKKSNKCISQWLHLNCRFRHQNAQNHSGQDTDEHLDV
jgi:hypothetical protein